VNDSSGDALGMRLSPDDPRTILLDDGSVIIATLWAFRGNGKGRWRVVPSGFRTPSRCDRGREAAPAAPTLSILGRGTGRGPARGKAGCARRPGIAWTECVRRPQPETRAKPRYERVAAVLPAVHRLTALTAILL